MDGEADAPKVVIDPQFGIRLKEERIRHKLRQWQLAEKMKVSRGTVSRVETASLRPTPDFAQRVDEALGTGRLFRGMLPTSQNEITRLLSRYVTIEQTQAVALFAWQGSLVPALLQIPDYARVVRAAAIPAYTRAEIEAVVTSQERRQGAMVRDEAPLRAHFVLAEGALRQLVGGRELMRRQWHKLVEWVALPSVTIQMLPAEVGAHPALQGSYTILDTALQAPLAGQAALYVETMASGEVITDPQSISHARERFGLLMAHALSPGETVAYLQRLMDEEEATWQ